MGLDYALDLLIPILLGLWGGDWLVKHWHWNPLWEVALPILGLAMGIYALYRKLSIKSTAPTEDPKKHD